MPVTGKNVAVTTVGLLFMYSGIKGIFISTALRDLLQGKNPGTETTQEAVISTAGNSSTGSSSSKVPGNSKTSKSGGTPAGREPAVSGSAAQNQALARMLVPASWRTGTEWNDLIALWNQESGWSNTADTRQSGLDPANATEFAYGIPQARNYTKMPKSAWPPDKGGSADARAQIEWGITYIKTHIGYGSPSRAWAHEQAEGWY